jgi:predicted nucleotidyltransferase
MGQFDKPSNRVTEMINPLQAKLNIRKKNITMQLKRDQLLEEMNKDAVKIINFITRNYSPQKIYQWGSLVNSEKFSTHSDIDIAIEGICDPENFFNLLGDVLRLTRHPVDIVQLEKIEPEFAELIKENGRVVYERE